jgi:hypothetical protein
MGILNLLLFPVTLPLDGVQWLGAKVADAVDAQWNDPARIEAALLSLESQLEAGTLTEAEFEAGEAELLAELSAMRARRAGGLA